MDALKFIRNVLILFVFVVSCGDQNDPQDDPNNDIASQGEFIDDWTYKVFPAKNDNFTVAEFRLWVPSNIDEINAILILASSYNSNGLGLAHLNDWQEYAEKENLSLLSVHLKSTPTGNSYTDASGGSGAALLKAVEAITNKHNIKRINSLPFLSRGYSGGGSFSFSFSVFLEDRTIAFANIRGQMSILSITNTSTPGLVIMGENDLGQRNYNILNSVLSNRGDGALWCYAIEPVVDHFGELVESDILIKQFFSVALKRRLAEDGSKPLQYIMESSGWLGDNITKEAFPYAEYPNSTKVASWLIDSEFANSWRNFQIK
jgi:hypothetical protein